MGMPGAMLGLDVGDVRTGVATSDPMGILASPREVLDAQDVAGTISRILAIAKEYAVVRIVAGIPLNQHGEVGPQAEKVLAFLDQLRAHTDLEIVTQDERFTTTLVHRQLSAQKVKNKKRKGQVDQLAAAHILQSYLDRLQRGQHD